MEKRSPLAMARKLDEKQDELSSEEAELVSEVLPRLRVCKKVKPAQLADLEKIYEKYFGEDSDEEEDPDEAEDEEIDDDDFV